MARLTKLSRSIEGKVALVTGAASGMGRATAHLFADEGAHVAVTDIDSGGVARVVDEITTAGLSAKGWTLDLADANAIDAVVAKVANHFGGLDILVNNAGLSRRTSVDDAEFEENWDHLMNVMLTAQMRMIRAALPHLRKSAAARVVNIASTEALGATPGNSPYATAKHGVAGLTRAFAVDLGREGITVNCICPGAVHTAITERIPDEHKQIFARRRVPLARYADPEEVAHATLSLVLPAASYINGAVLPVDGGLTIKNA